MTMMIVMMIDDDFDHDDDDDKLPTPTLKIRLFAHSQQEGANNAIQESHTTEQHRYILPNRANQTSHVPTPGLQPGF